jgi:hypothetical protein
MHYFINVLGIECRGLDIGSPTMVDKSLVFIGDCHSGESQEWARKNGPYDMIFIDADHSYEAVSLDYKLYKDMATKMIVFHDIDQNVYIGVRQLWDEIEGDKLEIWSPGGDLWLGIGILFL